MDCTCAEPATRMTYRGDGWHGRNKLPHGRPPPQPDPLAQFEGKSIEELRAMLAEKIEQERKDGA